MRVRAPDYYGACLLGGKAGKVDLGEVVRERGGDREPATLGEQEASAEVQEEPRDRSGPQSPRRKALLHPEPLGGPSAEPRPHLMGAEPRTGRQSRCQRTAGPERAAMGRVTTQQFPVGLCVCVHMHACVHMRACVSSVAPGMSDS